MPAASSACPPSVGWEGTSRNTNKGCCTSRSPGAASKRTEQRCRQSGHIRFSCVIGESPDTKDLPPTFPATVQEPPRVTGWGAQAHAALVDALVEAGEVVVAEHVADCGLVPLPVTPQVTVHSRGGGCRHMGGLTHCGRFQLCPQCTPFLMAKRLAGLEGIGMKLASDSSLRHFTVVLSVRHHCGAHWKTLVKALRGMQSALRRSHRWREVVAGFLRLLESTYGRNGHHPHEHILVSLRVPDDFDAEGFFSWVRTVCEREAEKAGRTCNFQDGWWAEVPRERLAVALRYLGSVDKMGTSASNPLHEFSSSSKHQPLWCIPPKAYAQVWRDSFRVRWFGVGGCWACKDTVKSDEEVEQERQKTGEIIAHILRETWRSWTPRERRDRRAVICDRTLTDAQAVDYVVACGGIAGAPSEPDWGEVTQ